MILQPYPEKQANWGYMAFDTEKMVDVAKNCTVEDAMYWLMFQPFGSVDILVEEEE